jgi:hypothetical protein
MSEPSNPETGSAGVPSIAVVMPTGADRPIIEPALRAALDDPGTAEAIVVIAAEDPAAAEKGKALRRLRAWAATEPRLRIITPPADVNGLWRVQRARDEGVEAARTEVVLSLDDDVILDPGVVSAHATAHRGVDDLVVLGYMPVATHQRWPRGNATIRYYARSYEGHCKGYEEHPDEILEALWGGNVSVRRDRWLKAVERPRTSAWGHDDQELGLLFLRDDMRATFDRTLHGRHYYRRSLAGFVERAEKSPAGQTALRAANLDLLEEPPRGRGRRDILAGPILAASRVSLVWGLVRGGLEGAMAIAGVLRLEKLGDALARYLWFLARERAIQSGAS